MSTLLDTVVDVFVTRFGIDADQVVPSASFEDLGLDSLSQIELVTALEKRLGIKIDDDELIELSTVSQVVAVLEEKGVTV